MKNKNTIQPRPLELFRSLSRPQATLEGIQDGSKGRLESSLGFALRNLFHIEENGNKKGLILDLSSFVLKHPREWNENSTNQAEKRISCILKEHQSRYKEFVEKYGFSNSYNEDFLYDYFYENKKSLIETELISKRMAFPEKTFFVRISNDIVLQAPEDRVKYYMDESRYVQPSSIEVASIAILH